MMDISLIKKLKEEKMQIYPVLVDKKGNVIDGNHRLAANPKWKKVIIEEDDPLKILKMKIHANEDRRDTTKEERQEWALEAKRLLVEQGAKGTEREIAKALGMSKTVIRKWLLLGLGVTKDKLLRDSERQITPYGENIYYLSEINNKAIRKEAFHVIEKGQPFPTLKRRSWFFHPNGREFSLREYAQVQEFPDSFIFVGTKEKIKDQIGNAVAPTMAEFIAKKIPKSNAIELFAGCGGMSLGFEKAGHNILWANDNNMSCFYTYKINFPKVIYDVKDIEKIKVEDIKKVLKEKIDLVFGGPPCQGFSISGLRFKDDPRNILYKQFIKIVDGIKPKWFVMENVKGIAPFIEQIKKDFEKIGYIVNVELVKGEEIGMRQKRHRYFFIGERNRK
jgi:site-specific DNA-cytosine methylase